MPPHNIHVRYPREQIIESSTAYFQNHDSTGTRRSNSIASISTPEEENNMEKTLAQQKKTKLLRGVCKPRPMKPESQLGPSQKKRRELRERETLWRENYSAQQRQRVLEAEIEGMKRPGGACSYCRIRKISCIFIPTTGRCINCTRKKCRCVDYFENLAVVVKQTPSIHKPAPKSEHETFTIEWYKCLHRSRQEMFVSHLIEFPIEVGGSGMPNPRGKCRRCHILGAKCLIIRPGSFASRFSSSTRCSRCIWPREHTVGLPRDCNPAGEAELVGFLCQEAALDKFSQEQPQDNPKPMSSDQQPTPIAHRKLFIEPIEPDNIIEQIGSIEFTITRLFRALQPSQETICKPLTDSNLDKLEDLEVDQSYPKPTDMIQHLLHVSGMIEMRRRIHELKLQDVSFEDVFSAVTAMTLFNTIFQDDPFDRDLLSLRISEFLCIEFETQPETATYYQQYFRVLAFDENENFRASLVKTAQTAGEMLWNILTPLTQLLPPQTTEEIESCRIICVYLAKLACDFNAMIKARTKNPGFLWGVPGQSFDTSQFEGRGAGRIRWPLMFGFKGGVNRPFMYKKGMVVGE